MSGNPFHNTFYLLRFELVFNKFTNERIDMLIKNQFANFITILLPLCISLYS